MRASRPSTIAVDELSEQASRGGLAKLSANQRILAAWRSSSATLATRPGPRPTDECGTLPGRAVLSKSRISPGHLARRLRIEETYSLWSPAGGAAGD